MGVFTPTLPALAGFVGDVPVFQEWIRWFGKDDPMDVAEMLGHPDLIGNLGCAQALQPSGVGIPMADDDRHMRCKGCQYLAPVRGSR